MAQTELKEMRRRALPSLKEVEYPEDPAFFTTEPVRNKRVFTQRKKPK